MSTITLGSSLCQCAGCGRHFTSTSTFDRHRAWATKGGVIWRGRHAPADYQERARLNPADVGLHQRANGAWGGAPMTDEQKAARGWAS